MGRSARDRQSWGSRRLSRLGHFHKRDGSTNRGKDFWDKLQSLSVLLSGTIVALIGAYATSAYNARQLEINETQKARELAVSRVQVAEKFFPHLISGDEKAKAAALFAIASLGDEEFATRLALQFKGEGAATALSSLSESKDTQIASRASQALTRVLATEHFESSVYRVYAESCADGGARVGTGFRMQGLVGIVTALHLVVDCHRVTAESAQQLGSRLQLTLTKVDIDHNAALLEPTANEVANSGLQSGRIGQHLGDVTVAGFPSGVRALVRAAGRVDAIKLRKLGDVLPRSTTTQLARIGSPSLLADVVMIHGAFPAGYAGAPVIDDTGAVVAILALAVDSLSFAFPYSSLNWVPSSDRASELMSLGQAMASSTTLY